MTTGISTAAISRVETAPRPLAVVRVTAVLSQWLSQCLAELDKVYAAVKAGYVPQNGQNVMVYRMRQNGLADIECGIETGADFAGAPEIHASRTPPGAALTAAHVGPYNGLHASYRSLTAWARENGYRLKPVCWEAYGDWDPDPAKLRTEIFYLLEP